MNTYISLLRGINVSGQKIIKMDELKKLYESLNFQNVLTYIQSGNLIFQSKEKDTDKLKWQIEEKIKNDFGYDVVVVIRTDDDFKNIVKNNPFNKPEYETKKIYMIYLSEPVDKKLVEEFNSGFKGEEKFVFGENEIYVYYTNGYGRSKVDSNFLERRLKTKSTARNWNTTTKLLGLATKE